MLRDFASPIGDVIVKGCQTLVQWGAALPRGDQVLSTWSHHSDQTGSCFIEGDFYSEAWGHWPRTGGDPHLAQLTLDRVLSGGPAEIDNLNGLFSGFVFSAAEGRLWIFVDRLGARLLFYRRGESGRWYVASDLYGLEARAWPAGSRPFFMEHSWLSVRHVCRGRRSSAISESFSRARLCS